MKKNIPVSGDYTNAFNPYIFECIPANSECLDIGCWTGNLGKILIKKKQCTVDGVDVDTSVLKKAKENGYRKVYKINLNNDPLVVDLPRKQYDVVILADVLEHLIDPGKVLVELKKTLRPDGIIIVSMPNVGFLLNRLTLLMGKWEYREFGCMDKTHLRFFTITSAKRLVESSGYHIEEVKPYNQFGLLQYLNSIGNIYPPLFAYQTRIIARLP